MIGTASKNTDPQLEVLQQKFPEQRTSNFGAAVWHAQGAPGEWRLSAGAPNDPSIG